MENLGCVQFDPLVRAECPPQASAAMVVHGCPCPQKGFCVGHLPLRVRLLFSWSCTYSWRMNGLSTSQPAVGAECVGSSEDPIPSCLPGKLPELTHIPTSPLPCFQPCLTVSDTSAWALGRLSGGIQVPVIPSILYISLKSRCVPSKQITTLMAG